MKSDKLLFTIVVCSYNGAEKLPATIRSLRTLKYPKTKYEIVVVDDGSTDKTVTVAKRFKGVRITSHGRNLGIAAARNSGMSVAKGKYIAYIDDDCTAHPQWLNELETALKGKNVIVAGGLIKARSIKAITQRYLIASGYGRPAPVEVGTASGIVGRFAAYIKDKFKSVRAKATTQTVDVHEVYGANVAFPASKLKSIRGFSCELNTSEDADVCQRLHQKHPKGIVRFNPKAIVKHDYTSSYIAYLKKLFVRQVDTLKFYQQQRKMPPLYPFPVLVALLTAVGFVLSPVIGVALLLLAPLGLYAWWPYSAAYNHRFEHIVYAYMEWLEESTRVAGLLRALVMRRFAGPLLPKFNVMRSHLKNVNGKQRLFAGLAAWFILTNVLQVATGPLQSITALLMLALLPGTLLLLGLRVAMTSLRAWLYAFGLSVALLVCTALLTNTAVLLSDGAWRLSRLSFFISTNILLLGLFVFAWLRCKTPRLHVSLDRYKVLAFLAAAFMPFAGVLASLYLNQAGNNVLSMTVLAGLFAILGTSLFFLKKMPAWLTPLIIYSVSLTITLMGALRGMGVSGTDISKEFYLYGLVQQLGYWSPSIFPDPYNACLTIHLLPSLLADLMKVNGEMVYRVVLPSLYAMLPVMVYALYRRFNAKMIAFAGALFFMIQPVFMKWSAVPIRQMFAFLFFAGLLLAIFDKRLTKPARYTILALFGAGVIFSHYSTAYITLGILTLTFLVYRSHHLFAKYIQKKTLASWRPLITAPLLIGLIATAVIWYGPITHASGHARTLFGSGLKQVAAGNVNIIGSKAHAEQASLVDQFNINSAPRSPEEVWKDYLAAVDKKYKRLNVVPLQNKLAAAPISPSAPEKMPYKVPEKTAKALALGGIVMSKATRVFLLIGLAIFVWQVLRRRTQHEEFNLLTLSAAIAIFLIIVVPYASIDYDIGRTSQQLLTLLALPTVVGGIALARFLTRNKLRIAVYQGGVAVFILGSFIFISSFVSQLTGGQQPNMLLNNNGVQYQIAVQEGETAAAAWLAANQHNQERIHSGYFGRNRLWTAGIPRSSLYNDILPWTIDRKAYVFASYAEIKLGQATTYYNGSFVVYDYPAKLLNERKNILYSNDQARIYK